MMNYRILHCGKSLDNYYKCINEKVIGFTQKVAEIGDIIFLAIRFKNKTLCGAKAIIDTTTNYKPWENSDDYIQSFKIKNIEYCRPFDLKILSKIAGKKWGFKYLLSSKAIKDKEAIVLLENEFKKNKCNNLYCFENFLLQDKENMNNNNIKNKNHFTNDKSNLKDKLAIMGTFETIKFINEQDEIQGLEKLVTDNFYNLFINFHEENSILISDNRKFCTAKMKDKDGENINGISGIPDALLITYSKNNLLSPLQINLIEYECYGKQKITIKQKSDYLNSHIIPQLMRFASTFSIVTDYKLRENTIKDWVDKITNFIYTNDNLINKTSNWIKQLYPDINQFQIALKLNELLKQAFENNMRIILIIDELTTEQNETIKNIIKAFKLNSNTKNNSIEFKSYVVRLERKINITNNNAQYALSFQE